MGKTGNKPMRSWVALLLALLLILPAPGAMAAETPGSGNSSVVEAASEESSSEQPLQQEEAVPSQDPEESLSSVEELASQAGEGTESPAEEESSRQEDNAALLETEEEMFDAAPLLKTGGHDAYMAGETGSRFYPDRAMTRAEMAQVLYNLLANPANSSKNPFSDVNSSSWYAAAVLALSNLGVLSGYEDGTFRPDNQVTRAEFVTAVCKCFGIADGSGNDFSDVSGHWALGYINAAAGNSWISGFTDGTFRPDNNITRAQVTAVLNKALEREDSNFAADSSVLEFVDVPTSHWAFEHIAEAADPAESDTSGTITGDQVRLRSGPGTTYASLGWMNSGDEVEVLSTYFSGWVQVRTSGGTVGYVSATYVEIEGEEPPSEDPQPGSFEVGQTVRVTADDGLNLRESPVDGRVIIGLTTGTRLTITSVESNGWLGVTTSNGTSGYVSGAYVAIVSDGNGTDGTATGATLSASSITMAQYQSARLDGSVTSNLSAMRWESSNENVVSPGYTVSYGGNRQGAMIYAVGPGTATITFIDADGTTSASCQVTVTAPEAVRFGYAEGNIVGAGESFDLVAITDTSRSEVQFTVTGPENQVIGSDDFEVESQQSAHGLPTNTVRVFRGSASFDTPGDYTVKVTSKNSAGWSSDSYQFTFRVIASNVAVTTATDDSRIPSEAGIRAIANFEGIIHEIRDDDIASGNPTVGHGYVVQQNVAFYNNMTEIEAYAQLVDKVNSGSYGAAVETFRQRYNIKMSQAQFDALTSFVYNLGAGNLSADKGVFRAMLNATDPTGISPEQPAQGTVSVTDIDTVGSNGGNAAPVYKSTDTDSDVVAALSLNTTVTVDDAMIQSQDTTFTDGTQQKVVETVWYHVTGSGFSGWMPAGYVTLAGNRKIDLTYADSTVVVNNLLQWSNASGRAWPGLVYRRLCEGKIFFFGNYSEDNTSSKWSVNTYGFHFPAYLEDYDSTQN